MVIAASTPIPQPLPQLHVFPVWQLIIALPTTPVLMYVLLLPGYYGDRCQYSYTTTPTPTTRIPCVAANNCSTHYTCNQDGTKKCLPGWTGSHCDQLVPNSVADCSNYDCKYFLSKYKHIFYTLLNTVTLSVNILNFHTHLTFCSQRKCEIRAGIRKILVTIANRENPDQTASSEAV